MHRIRNDSSGISMMGKEYAANPAAGEAEDGRGATQKPQSCSAACWGNLTRRDLTHFDKFVDTTATHGIRRIFTGKSKCRRLFWLLLFLAAAAGCLYNISVQIQFLISAPTATTISFERLESQRFPAVTICNQASLNYTAVVERYGQHVADYLNCALGQFRRETSNVSNITGYIDRCKRQYPIPPQQLNLSVSDIFKRSFNDPREFIVGCVYTGDPRAGECSFRNFTPVPTNNGFCYTFNRNFPESCSDNPPTRRLVATGAGQRFSLSVLLNIGQDDYPPFIQDAGALLEIHPALVPPRPLQRGALVPPGQQAYIGLTTTSYTFYDCQRNPGSLNFYRRYNIPTCVLNNLYTRVSKICGCVPPGAPLPCLDSELVDTPPCTLEQIGCYVENFFDTEGGGTDDDCEQECTNDVYSSSISYSKYPAKNFQNTSLPDFTSPEENLVGVEVYFEDLIVQRVTEEPAYDAIRLLADIGGQLGLFLGVSVLSVTEFLMWILDEVKDRLLCCKAVRQVVSCDRRQKKTVRDVELGEVYRHHLEDESVK